MCVLLWVSVSGMEGILSLGEMRRLAVSAAPAPAPISPPPFLPPKLTSMRDMPKEPVKLTASTTATSSEMEGRPDCGASSGSSDSGASAFLMR